MNRIYWIFRRDMKSSVREFLLLYIIIAPLLITIGLRFFIPSVNSISLQFALDEKLSKTTTQEFSQYGKIEIFKDVVNITKRVNKVDDIIGITLSEGEKYQVIMQGNEKEGLDYTAYQIINNLNNDSSDISISFSDIGSTKPELTIYGCTFLIIMAIIMAGMVIGLNIIEEKEAKTVDALNVTPMNKFEFILGKSIVGFLIPIVEAFIIIWILGLNDINFGMMLILTIVSSLITIIFGFLIGVLSSNQIAGIANFKFLLIIVSASCIGAMLLPESLQKFLYWSPLYWSTIGMIKIVTNTATWSNIWAYTTWIIGLTIIIFSIFKGKIKKGLIT